MKAIENTEEYLQVRICGRKFSFCDACNSSRRAGEKWLHKNPCPDSALMHTMMKPRRTLEKACDAGVEKPFFPLISVTVSDSISTWKFRSIYPRFGFQSLKTFIFPFLSASCFFSLSVSLLPACRLVLRKRLLIKC